MTTLPCFGRRTFLALAIALISMTAKAQTLGDDPQVKTNVPADRDNERMPSLQFAGYAKTILIDAKTPDPAADNYSLSINRLRVKLSYDVPSRFLLHIETDTNVRAGSYLRTTAFQQDKNPPKRQYWDGTTVLADKPGYYSTQSLFRAYGRLSLDAVDLTIGRQRIPLGTGRMWSALDMLNPINPLQIERDEYVGVDAALLEYKAAALSKYSMIYAPDPARANDRWLAQYRTNVSGTDITVSYGKFWREHIAEMDFSTQFGDAGLHGEAAHVLSSAGRSYNKFLIGLDYVFPNTFGISAEAYYSNQPKAERLAQFSANDQLIQVLPAGSRYAGLGLNYEFTPLLKMTTYVLANLSEKGRLIFPALSYSISDNLMLSGGVQMFSGRNDSDYGQQKNLYYTQLQWHF